MVGVTGFEPATSSTPRKRASRAAPHPDPLCLYDHNETNGELSRIRTWDLQFRRLALYPAELIAPRILNIFLFMPILTQTLLSFVRRNLVPFSFSATRQGLISYLKVLIDARF